MRSLSGQFFRLVTGLAAVMPFVIGAQDETLLQARPAGASRATNQTSSLERDGLFPFVLPWDDAGPSVMNLSA